MAIDTSARTHAAANTSLYQQAAVAGIIGGAIVDAFLILSHRSPFPGMYQFIASGLVGKAAFASTSYVWLGVAIHFAISIVWALLYAAVAAATGMLHRWLLGAIAFGVVVALGMQAVVTAAGLSHGSSPTALALSIVTHVVFFAAPIAWYLARMTVPGRVRR